MDKQRDKLLFYLNIGFFLLTVCIALFIFYISARGEPLTMSDLSLIVGLIIMFGVVGLGCLIYALVLQAKRAFGNKEQDEKETGNNDNKPSTNIAIKADTADIAKMNPKQLAVFKELLSKLPDKKTRERYGQTKVNAQRSRGL